MHNVVLPRFPGLLRRFPFLLAAAVALLPEAGAADWWDNAWAGRKKITIDIAASASAVEAPTGPVALLVRLHDGNFPFAEANADGSDLRFVAEDDTTVLPHAFEKYDSLLFNEAFVWVRLPEVQAGVPMVIRLYHGNPKARSVADSGAVWGPDAVLVYPFTETGMPAFDASGGGNTALTVGRRSDRSIIGPGLALDGITPVTLPDSPSLAWPRDGTMTWSAWVRPAAPGMSAVLFSRREPTGSFVIGLDAGQPYVAAGTGTPAMAKAAGGEPPTANAWQHLAVVAEGSEIRLFVGGELRATLPTGLPALATSATLGADPGMPGSVGFSGEVDQLEIWRVARPVSALAFAVASQDGLRSDSLVSVTDDGPEGGFLDGLDSGYMTVVLKNLTIDGWVVIVLCIIMSAISVMVMFGKAEYIRRAHKGNVRFIEQWRHLANDLSKLDSDEHTLGKAGGSPEHRAMRGAPLFRIYHIGVQEIRHRLSADREAGKGGGKALSARSIQAIRASLDAGLVRESQRLSSQMVLLTISISGGPFLGLLGTVVGVMITFAGVAAAGDVNVNAIAPGIAAALAATVAGLGVAIPALFGYNYLITRIKSISSDMHVFIDEFVTKMAEYYAESSS